MYQIHGHDPQFKKIRIVRPPIKDVELRKRRAQNDRRLKSIFESIFEKYEKDFDGVGDEIDLETGEIVVDNGHVSGLGFQSDIFGHHVRSDDDSKSEESEKNSTLDATDDVVENGCVAAFNSSSPQSIPPCMSALKNNPTQSLNKASPFRLCYDYEDELGMGSNVSDHFKETPIVRHNPWFLQPLEIVRDNKSTSPTWATPDLPMSAPRHFHRRLNALPARRPHLGHSNIETYTKTNAPIVPSRSPALTAVSLRTAPTGADTRSVEIQRHGQRKTVPVPVSPHQSDDDELAAPNFSQDVPARSAERNKSERHSADNASAGLSRPQSPSDSPHDFNLEREGSNGDVQIAKTSSSPSRSSPLVSRSILSGNSAPATLVSQISLENNHIQTIDSYQVATGSLPSNDQDSLIIRRSVRLKGRNWEPSGSHNASEVVQAATIPNLPAKFVREIPDSDSPPSSSEPQPSTSSAKPSRGPDLHASDRMCSTDGATIAESSPDRKRTLEDDEGSFRTTVQKHSSIQELNNGSDAEIQMNLQNLGLRSCSVKVVIPMRKQQKPPLRQSHDKYLLHDEDKADTVDMIPRNQGAKDSLSPQVALLPKADGTLARPLEHHPVEIPDSQPSQDLLYPDNDRDADDDGDAEIVSGFTALGGAEERRGFSRSLLTNSSSSELLTAPNTPTAGLTINTMRVKKQQRHMLPSPYTSKPHSALKRSLSQMCDDSDDDLALLLSSSKSVRRSKPVKHGVAIRKLIAADMATCGDDELA